jgi:hypothetical protein
VRDWPQRMADWLADYILQPPAAHE